jgi:hypothetical protein
MIGSFRGWTWHNWASLAVLAMSCAWAVMAAGATAAPLSGTPSAAPTPASASADAEVEARSDAEELDRLVLASVARDPFRSDRARASGRYRTPGEVLRAAAAPPAGSMPPPPPLAPMAAIRLHGMATDGAGGVLLAVEINGATRLMHVGEEFAGQKLLAVSRGAARFRGAGGVTTVRLDPAHP